MENLSEIKQQLNRIESGMLAQKNVLTFDEACQFSGIKKSFMYKLTHNHKIDFFKPRGKLIYFERESLESFLLQNPIKTNEQIEREASTYVTLNKGGR